ncbi:hypothetical protein [Sphingomonas sp. 28-63-12]|uniref:hypothetical protein n=1 Tax=Sphingomonas sp. 28-63-12 TaxID=1970434 RepID=UPI000BD20216|nr:MAG: hypothetical protein B7Y47_15345 [Sphingomonas sp. 28-63-12]
MNLAWRYGALCLGVIGTALVTVTLLLAAVNWQLVPNLDWQAGFPLSISILSGFLQWIVFQRRQFRAAITLFMVTMPHGSLQWVGKSTDRCATAPPKAV